MHPFDRFNRLEVPKDADPDKESLAPYYRPDEAWRRIDHDWLAATSDLAIALDNDTNNTSLVLAFELGVNGEVLLFPGDAQVGNWLSWEAMEFNVAGRGKVTAADLLSRCVFYKVGHHASHNATLREKGLERMTHRDLHAMIPVDAEMAEKKGWGQMPFNPLLARLREKCRGRVIRSDEGALQAGALAELDEHELKRYESAVGRDDLFIDLTFE
jgi:hypothetical protein